MIEIQADQRTFNALARALAAEAGGDALRRDLAADLREELAPAVSEVRSRLLASGSGGLPHGEPLLPAIAAGVKVDVRVGKRAARARIRASKRGMPRDFVNAPKRFNERSFRHHVFGREGWVEQVGAPGWFDDPLHDRQGKYRRAVERAMERCVRRITRRV